MTFSHRDRSTAEDRHRGDQVVGKHLVEAGRAYQACGAGEDEMHPMLVISQ